MYKEFVNVAFTKYHGDNSIRRDIPKDKFSIEKLCH